jgi:hypothetical protein
MGWSRHVHSSHTRKNKKHLLLVLTAAQILPVTREDDEYVVDEWRTRPKPVMPVAAMGDTPMLPVMDVVPVVLMPDLDSSAKSPAVPRLIGACPASGHTVTFPDTAEHKLIVVLPVTMGSTTKGPVPVCMLMT